MNKSIIYFILLAVMTFMACDPVVDRETISGAITVDQLDVSATLVTVDGKRANKVIVVNHSPVLSNWECGVLSSSKQTDTVLLFKQGLNEIEFTGLNADGTKITKTLTVDVEEMSFSVPPEYAMLFGEGEKEWTWKSDLSWGLAGYLGTVEPGWWWQPGSERGEQDAPGETIGASLVFSIKKAALTKLRNNGTEETGRFTLDMTKIKLMEDEKTVWAKGELNTIGTTVLCPYFFNSDPIEMVSTYDIIKLTEDELILAYSPAGTKAWGDCYFWVFVPKK
ncbi:MAG: hypothetical protein LBU84_06525 [Prevotella sp.]|nr:hypothetical protein [Prevotella sp.]